MDIRNPDIQNPDITNPDYHCWDSGETENTRNIMRNVNETDTCLYLIILFRVNKVFTFYHIILYETCNELTNII